MLSTLRAFTSAGISRALDFGVLAHSLLHVSPSQAVFRAAVFSIVLTLAASPTATLLCKAWCDRMSGPLGAADSGCRHTDPIGLTNVAEDNICDRLRIGVFEFVREDSRPVGSADRGEAIPAPRYQLAYSTTAEGQPVSSTAEWASETRPLSPPLRI
jgi:hypothetical protein